MARTVDPVARAVRREAFLDAAQRLIQSRGYAQLSLQDVITEVGASKGAFYHYFDSKTALLEGVVDRMVDAVTGSLAAVIADGQRPALSMFDALFTGLAQYKAERRELMLELARVWLSDENAIVREKMRGGVTARLTPLLAQIIRRGVAEGVFDTAAPDATARVFVALFLGTNQAATELFAAHPTGAASLEEAERLLGAFWDAFERLLGARRGSLGFERHAAVLADWFDPAGAPSPQEAPPRQGRNT